jgi:hypothetical protein
MISVFGDELAILAIALRPPSCSSSSMRQISGRSRVARTIAEAASLASAAIAKSRASSALRTRPR